MQAIHRACATFEVGHYSQKPEHCPWLYPLNSSGFIQLPPLPMVPASFGQPFAASFGLVYKCHMLRDMYTIIQQTYSPVTINRYHA